MPISTEKPREEAFDCDRARQRLENAGIRVNPERIQILGRLMLDMGRTQTAYDLCPRGGEESSAAVLARVYRTLHLLEKNGVIQRRVRQIHGRPVFTYVYGEEIASTCIRFQCRNCGASVDTNDLQFREQVAKFGADRGLPVASKENITVWIECNRCAAVRQS